MKFSLRHWGAGKLLLAWVAYWLALGAATLSPAIVLIARIAGTGAHGHASASIDNGLLSVKIADTGSGSWSGAIHFSSLVFLLFGPPLLLWVAWAMSRPRRDEVVNSSHVGDADEHVRALREAPYSATVIEPPRAPEARARRNVNE